MIVQKIRIQKKKLSIYLFWKQTNSKELLCLSSAGERMRYGRTEYTRESQFLRELDKTLLSGDAVYEPKKYNAGGGTVSGPGVSTGSADGYSQKAFKPYDYLKYPSR